jgi:hypothetical protein
MITFSGGDVVSPGPTTKNLDETRGVSTSLLFGAGVDKRRDTVIFPDIKDLRFKDIPDLVANPLRSNFFNTDCASCHSESTRRSILKLENNISNYKYTPPDGVSGLDPSAIPKDQWNVRNFGWGVNIDTTVVATVSVRTANETTESADFINKNYINQPKAKPVSNPLTLVMTIKGNNELQELKKLLSDTNSDPKNPITAALDKLGTVHFARFVFLDDRHLMVITTYDNDFDTYIDAFVNEIGIIFDELLKRMDGAPPLPVSDHRKEFLKYVKDNDKPSASFYSAYPDLKTLDIKTLQKKKADK